MDDDDLDEAAAEAWMSQERERMRRRGRQEWRPYVPKAQIERHIDYLWSHGIENDEHRVPDVDGVTAYFSQPYGASVDWTPESLEWWRRWQAFLKLKAGLMFFVAVAVAMEEALDA